METVTVDVKSLEPVWRRPAEEAVANLSRIFARKKIGVKLTSRAGKARITIRIDPSIQGTITHGKTRAMTNGRGRLLEARIGLPKQVMVSVPGGPRPAGPGPREVIVAHELVHALGDTPHTTHLMAKTMRVVMGDSPAGDRLEAGGVKMPAIVLGRSSVDTLQKLWG